RHAVQGSRRRARHPAGDGDEPVAPRTSPHAPGAARPRGRVRPGRREGPSPQIVLTSRVLHGMLRSDSVRALFVVSLLALLAGPAACEGKSSVETTRGRTVRTDP